MIIPPTHPNHCIFLSKNIFWSILLFKFSCSVFLIQFLAKFFCPPASVGSWEVANLTESKNPHAPVYGVKYFVHLSVRLTLYQQLPISYFPLYFVLTLGFTYLNLISTWQMQSQWVCQFELFKVLSLIYNEYPCIQKFEAK